MNKTSINKGFRNQPNDETLINSNDNQSSQYNFNPQKIHNNSNDNTSNILGETLDGFTLQEKLPSFSKEADIYRAINFSIDPNKPFILKYYRRKNAIKPQVLEKIRSLNSPYLASIISYGAHLEYQYVVMPYYKNKSLGDLLNSGKTFTLEELKTLIIPSINEGLNVLHNLGLIYKNLKPSNLILDDARKNIVLTDFGGCSDNLGCDDLGSDTNTETKDKTFNHFSKDNPSFYYLAPEAIQGVFNKETDYYALGITLFELFTGVTPYQTLQNLQYSKKLGLTQDEIVHQSLINKLEFPENFPESLKNLVLGLTYVDLSNPKDLANSKAHTILNRRWGYTEVNNWLKGIEHVVPKENPQVFTNIDKTTNIDNLTNINKPTNISNPSNNPIDTNDPINKPFNINNSISKSINTPRETPQKENTAIYRFNDIKYLNLQELILAMFKDIPNGIKDLERGKLTTFFDNNEIFRENLGKLCYEAQNNLSNGKLPKAQIFTALLYDLKPNMQSV